MNFSYIRPSPVLQDVIRDYLIAHFRFDRRTRPPLKPYAPKPEQGLTFFARGRPSMVNVLTGEARTAPRASLFGQQVTRCDVRLAPEFLMFRVHFRAGALFRVLNIPLAEFGEHYFDAEAVLGREVHDVAERLAAARSYTAMVETVEAYLLRIVAGAKRGVDAVDRAAAHMATDPLHTSVAWLAREAALSPRHFNRSFTERIGVGPKLYGRLLRYHHAYLYRAAHPGVAWTTVALECGYTDYQHMVRDFRQFANATPDAWRRADDRSPENVLPRSATA
jgi:AraC-like DNA-binding protein